MRKNFRVAVRVRPPLGRELQDDFQNTIALSSQSRQIIISDNIDSVVDRNGAVMTKQESINCHVFTFDNVYGEDSTQEDIYESSASDVVLSSLAGYNATIFAYVSPYKNENLTNQF